jgi:hypothetical protein
MASGERLARHPISAIYDKAAPEDFSRSAMFFGQLVWYTVMNRPERWGSGRYGVDGRDIGSRTYFRLTGSGTTEPSNSRSSQTTKSPDSPGRFRAFFSRLLE